MKLWLAAVFSAALLCAQTRDVIGIHDLSGGSGSPITGGLPGSCMYCHAPHNGVGGCHAAVEPETIEADL